MHNAYQEDDDVRAYLALVKQNAKDTLVAKHQARGILTKSQLVEKAMETVDEQIKAELLILLAELEA
jgi:hypothetical protein